MRQDNTIENPTKEDLSRSLKNKKHLNDLLDKAIKQERQRVVNKSKTDKPTPIAELPNPFEDSDYKTD